MIGLGGMVNRWWGLWWLFLIVICIVLTLYDLYVIVINDGVYVVDKMNVPCWSQLLTLMKTWWQQVVGAYEEGLMEEGGIYVAADVMVGGGKW